MKIEELKPETTTNSTASASIDSSSVSVSDIISRSSKNVDQDSSADKHLNVDDLKASIKLDDIKDPVARSLFEKRLKELESGFNKKYQQVAEIRKDLESKSSQNRTWTQEELDRALKDPSFISLVQARQQQAAAQAAPNGWEGTTEEWSALTPEERQQFAQLNQKVAAQEQIMMRMLQSQEDSHLKQVYPDYDSKIVDKIQEDLMTGRVQASREHLWKVANFENAVKQAYKLGLEDSKGSINEKLRASNNLTAHNVTENGDVPEEIKKKGFGAIGRWRLEQFKMRKKSA